MTKAEFVDAMVKKYDSYDLKKKLRLVKQELAKLPIWQLLLIATVTMLVTILLISSFSLMNWFDPTAIVEFLYKMLPDDLKKAIQTAIGAIKGVTDAVQGAAGLVDGLTKIAADAEAGMKKSAELTAIIGAQGASEASEASRASEASGASGATALPEGIAPGAPTGPSGPSGPPAGPSKAPGAPSQIGGNLPKVPGIDGLPKIPGIDGLPKIPGIDGLPKIPGLDGLPKIPGLDGLTNPFNKLALFGVASATNIQSEPIKPTKTSKMGKEDHKLHTMKTWHFLGFLKDSVAIVVIVAFLKYMSV